MKILFIHNAYGKYSGEEAVVEVQMALLRKHGHEVQIYSRSSGDLGVHLYGKFLAFFTGLYNPGSVIRVKRLLHTFQPDVVHVHNLYPSVSPAVLPAIRKKGLPVVMTVHNYRLVCPNGLFYTKGAICERCAGKGKEWNCVKQNCEQSFFKSTGYALRNWWARKSGYYLKNVDAYACLTQFQQKKLIANGFPVEKTILLPNFVQASHQSDCSEERPLSIHELSYIAFAGRLNGQKGFDLLCTAMHFNKNITLKAAGAADEEFIGNIVIPENLHLCGKLNQSEMELFWKGARFLVFTSASYEGFPMVFLEAMHHHLPVVAPRMAGYPEIIEDGVNGLLYTPGDAIDLADKIRQLWEDKLLCARLGENGYRKLIENYSEEIFYKELMEVYEKLV